MPATPGTPVPVTTENFVRAESDMYFGNVVRLSGGVGKLNHHREPVPVEKQNIVRTNRDTLYSSAVFDLDAGPVTITMPDPGTRFMSMQVFDEDQFVVELAHGAGRHTYAKDRVGTRYVMVAFRTLADPNDPRDIATANALQDTIAVEQENAGAFETPKWDEASQKKIRDALLVLGESLPDSRRMFGSKNEVDPVRRLIGAAMAWGGNPEKEATYLNVTPDRNDGKTVYALRVKGVPVDGFWSITVYGPDGYLRPNKLNAYSLNNITAKKDADGSITVQFGGCDGGVTNCLPITPGWNYLVRLYLPRPEILDGTWRFPEAVPV